MNFAPNSVSGRVVKTVITAGPAAAVPATGKLIIAPSLRPIQFRCIVLIGSGQSSGSRSASSRSAYAVIRSIHCRSGRR